MDPLSVTAAIIAIVGAGGTVGRGIRKLVALRNAPDSLLQLNNEVTELQLIVQTVDINSFDNSVDDSAAAAQYQLIQNALGRVKTVVLELEKLIEYSLTKITDRGPKIDKVAWLGAEKKIIKLKEKIRIAKTDLATASSIGSLVTSKRVELQLSGLRITSEGTSLRYVELENLVISMSRAVLHQGQSIGEVLQTGFRRPTNSGEASTAEEQSPIVSVEPRQSRDPSGEHCRDNVVYPGTLHVEFTKYQACASTCLCSCHRQIRMRSPRLLNDILGSLFIGYSGLPCYQQSCDRNCKQGSSEAEVRLKYTFPRWMLNRILCIRMASSKMKGPELLLRCLRPRPESSPIFEAVRVGDVCRVRDLLVNSEASLFDVDPHGRSILHHTYWSPRHPRALLVEMLLQLRADPFQTDDLMVSPYQIYWTSALNQRCTESDRVWMASTFCQEDPVEHFAFSKLHLAILNLQHTKSFDHELLATPRIAIDQRDSRGRTPLAWAACQGKVEVVRKLLQRGADPNIADLEGNTPLHLATWLGGYLGVHCLDSLLQGGAKIDACNVYGQTALNHTIHYDRPEPMKFLLENGAEHCYVDENRENLLHKAARYGSLPILSTMRQVGLHRLDTELVDEYGWTAMRLAERRRDHNARWSEQFHRPEDEHPSKWFHAFEDLLDSIRAADIADSFTDFVALANGDLEWDLEEDSGQGSQEGWMSLPGSFPLEEDEE